MARCFVTVEGRTLSVEARSLHFAAIEYKCAQVCGFAREFPPLQRDTVITVQVEGSSDLRRVTWGAVLDWANRAISRRCSVS